MNYPESIRSALTESTSVVYTRTSYTFFYRSLLREVCAYTPSRSSSPVDYTSHRQRMMIGIIIIGLLPLGLAQQCLQFGTSQGDSCLCPPGFNPSSGGNGTCSLPVCGGSLYESAGAAPAGSNGLGSVDSGCGCTSGWTGPGCTGRSDHSFRSKAYLTVCQTADACTVSLNRYLNTSTTTPQGINSSLTCSASPFVYTSSQLSCSVVQPTVQALFPGDTILTITRTLNSSLTPGGVNTLTAAGLTSGDGVAYAQLWLDGVEQFYCQAQQCVQTEGSGNGSTWDCGELDCVCRPGAAFCGGGQVSSLFSKLSDAYGRQHRT